MKKIEAKQTGGAHNYLKCSSSLSERRREASDAGPRRSDSSSNSRLSPASSPDDRDWSHRSAQTGVGWGGGVTGVKRAVRRGAARLEAASSGEREKPSSAIPNSVKHRKQAAGDTSAVEGPELKGCVWKTENSELR